MSIPLGCASAEAGKHRKWTRSYKTEDEKVVSVPNMYVKEEKHIEVIK